MADVYRISGDTLSGIADAIREKRGITTEISPVDMAMQIGLIEAGGGMPTGFSAIKFGTYEVTTAFTTTRQTVTHDLGVTPDLIFIWHDGNIATSYSMLWAFRCPQMTYRGSGYDSYMAYHGNSTTTVTMTNSNSTSYGVSNMTATTFQLASSSSSYYWRAGTYKWVAIKFA